MTIMMLMMMTIMMLIMMTIMMAGAVCAHGGRQAAHTGRFPHLCLQQTPSQGIIIIIIITVVVIIIMIFIIIHVLTPSVVYCAWHHGAAGDARAVVV